MAASPWLGTAQNTLSPKSPSIQSIAAQGSQAAGVMLGCLLACCVENSMGCSARQVAQPKQAMLCAAGLTLDWVTGNECGELTTVLRLLKGAQVVGKALVTYK
jgi:hypothetical protein